MNARGGQKCTKTEDGTIAVVHLEPEGRMPIGSHRDKGTSNINSLLPVAFVVPDAVHFIMTWSPLDLSNKMIGDPVSLELHPALQQVLALVLRRTVLAKREYNVLPRAFLQACIEWKLDGAKLVAGPVHATLWQVDDTKIDVVTVWNMFSEECFTRVAGVVVKAQSPSFAI